MTEQNRNEPAFIAAQARIVVPPERLDAVAAGLAVTGATVVALFRHDYGANGPAARFVPPSAR